MNQEWIKFNDHYIKCSAITCIGFLKVESGHVIDICANNLNFNKHFTDLKEAQKEYADICITLRIAFKFKEMSCVM